MSDYGINVKLYNQTPFLIEVAEYIQKVGGKRGLQRSKEAGSARTRIQELFAEFVEEKIFKQERGAKQAQGGKSAADLFVPARDAELVFGIDLRETRVSQTDELQRVAIELKSSISTGTETTTATQKTPTDTEDSEIYNYLVKTGKIKDKSILKKGVLEVTKESFKITDLSGPTIKDIVVNSNTQFAINFRKQIEEKSVNNISFTLNLDKLKKGDTPVKFKPALTADDMTFNLDRTRIQVKYGEGARKKSEEALFRFTKAPEEVSKEFKKYVRMRLRTSPNKAINRLISIAMALEPGATPVVTSLSYKMKDVAFVANIKAKKGVSRTSKKPQQRFISSAQLTALVKRRLGERMPKGPRRGPPLAETILTERSGRFRTSIQVIADYRRNVLSYYYDPLYRVFNNTQRDPDDFVPDTIREVVQTLFARQFNIVRRYGF